MKFKYAKLNKDDHTITRLEEVMRALPNKGIIDQHDRKRIQQIIRDYIHSDLYAVDYGYIGELLIHPLDGKAPFAFFVAVLSDGSEYENPGEGDVLLLFVDLIISDDNIDYEINVIVISQPNERLYTASTKYHPANYAAAQALMNLGTYNTYVEKLTSIIPDSDLHDILVI